MSHYSAHVAGRVAGISVLLLSTGIVLAQTAPAIEWQRSFGGSHSEWATAVQITPGGAYVIAGSTGSTDGDALGRQGLGSYDAFVSALGVDGTILWKRAVGSDEDDYGHDLHLTTDGGCVLAASGDMGEASGIDALLAKLSHTGAVQHQLNRGDDASDMAYAILQTDDGGYIMAGSATFDTLPDWYGVESSDAWVVKFKASGTIEWELYLGGTGSDAAEAIQQTDDGGYIVAGRSHATHDGSGCGDELGFMDAWLAKLDGAGAVEWQQCYGGSDFDEAFAVQQVADGGYIMAGYTQSYDGDVTDRHPPHWHADAWVVKLDASGVLQWERALGGSAVDIARDIRSTTDGGYIMAGSTQSENGDVIGLHGNGAYDDAWLVKLDGTGNLQWQRPLGGSYDDYAYAVRQTPDGGYIMAGSAKSGNGDVSGHHGNNFYADAWIVKLAPDGGTPGMQPQGGNEGGHGPAHNELLAGQELTLHPSITTGLVQLSWNREGASMAHIVDATGRVVAEQTVAGRSLAMDLSAYRNGMYLVKLLFEEGAMETRRVVKQ